MDHTTLEQQIFTWQNWQQDDVNAMTFYDVVLKVSVGDFPAGTRFDYASLDGERSVLTLVDANETEYAFTLSLTVGEKLDMHDVDACDRCGHDYSF